MADFGGQPIDLTRPIINNADNTFSTERTITVEIDGEHVVLPTIVNGKELSPQDAVKAFRQGTNKAVGRFTTASEADIYAKSRSQEIGKVRGIEARQPMTNFLDGLNELGGTINAPFRADPNLNLAGLLLGAGLLQPVQPGQTAAGAAGQALVGSLDFLAKQRGAQAKLAQERDIEAAKVGAYKEKTQAELEQGRTQFTAREAAEQRRHEEVMSRLNQQYQLALAAKEGDKLRDRGNIAKMGYDSADAFVEAYPDNFLSADGKTIDRRKVDIFRTIQSNRMLRQFGHAPQDFLPYGNDDVNAMAQLAKSNPSLYQVRIGELAQAFGPKFQDDVANAVLQAPAVAATTPAGTTATEQRRGPGFEPATTSEGLPGLGRRISKAIRYPDAFVKTDSGEELLEPGKMVTIGGKQYKAVAPAGKGKWQLLDSKGIARFYRVDRTEE